MLIARLPGAGPTVDPSLRVGFEHDDYFGFRWWPLDQAARRRKHFYPGRLPEALPKVLPGEGFVASFELWS